ncbi:unnamed protein product [Medioppia subpectinata]|uniref:Uncharacterized protein n=1 Tax=Medioppia subpectinata TaxID=1979941 RepID=A0A7R9KIC7_9ACAR|nr:unnamed protein product [Medioppia subpectinata]CAG2104237.1 unnamed protein product [Medioppia subpectinata]
MSDVRHEHVFLFIQQMSATNDDNAIAGQPIAGQLFGLFGCADDYPPDGSNCDQQVVQTGDELVAKEGSMNEEIEAIDANYCVICKSSDTKYCCPKCQLKSCSMICCKTHKLRFNCNGVRDKTTFVKISDFSQQDFLSDYFFLEDVDRTLDNSGRQRRAIINSKNMLPKWLQKLVREARVRGIDLKIMPGGFKRRKQNTTCFMYANNTINWDIEFKFIHALDNKEMKNLDQLLADDLVVSHSEFSCVDRRVSEETPLLTLLSKYIETNDLIDCYERNCKLVLYRKTGIDGISVLFRKENLGSKEHKYYELDVNKTIKDNLVRKKMSSNEISSQLSHSGESTEDVVKNEDSVKKSAFNWEVFDERANALKDLRQKREFVDISLETEDGGQELAHFAVVSALGKYFTECVDKELNSPDVQQETLDNGFVVKKVLLKTVTKSVLKILVDCSYNGYIETNSETVWPLIKTAVEYELLDVLEWSLTFLIRQLDVQNCVELFHLGLKYKHQLSNASYAFIKTNFTEIVNICVNFWTLDLEELKTLLDDDELNIQTERTAFDAIIRWIHYEIDTRKAHLSTLISILRFARLELSFIDNDIMKNALILDDKEAVRIVNTFKDKYNSFTKKKDGNGLYVGLTPVAIRPRIPHEIILAFGGWQEGVPSTLMEAYDLRTNRWFDTKISHDSPRAYHGMQIIDGMVYVIGGTNGTEILNTVQCFNPITRKWFERSPMGDQRCYVSTVSIDGIIYAMGGHNGRQRIKTCEKYNTKEDKWTAFEDMNMSRSDGSAAVHQNKIYIAGGLNDQIIENTVECYDFRDNTWSFIHPMITPRTSLGFVSLNQSLFAIGGNNGFERLQSVERYDFKLRTWLPVGNMNSKRSTFGTVVIGNQLYVIGGYNGQTPICSVERFDSNQMVWKEMKSLKHDRSGLAVCVATGLSNSVDYTFIGKNKKSAKKADKKSDTNDSKDNTSDEIECPNGWTQFENKCFLFYTDKSFLNFYESHIVCKDFFNATLVSIHSKEEQTFLTKYAFFTNKAQNHVWIGARRTFNETFVWEDNSAFNYTNWAKTQPNNLDGKHFCTSLLQSPNLSDLGFWYDDPCADKYHFICQIYLADNTLDSLNNSSALVINTSATVDNSTTERILTFDELKALHNNSANISTISALISSSTVKEKQHFSYYNTVLTVLAVVQLIL